MAMAPNIGSDKVVIRAGAEMKAKVVANARALGMSVNEYMLQLMEAAPEMESGGIIDKLMWSGGSSYQISCNSSIFRVNAHVCAECGIDVCPPAGPSVSIMKPKSHIEVAVMKLTAAMKRDESMSASASAEAFEDAVAEISSKLSGKVQARDWPRLKAAVELCIKDASSNLRLDCAGHEA